MGQKYTIRKAEGKHLVYENRIHLAREWNRRINANDAKLSSRAFARKMNIPESSWRREYWLEFVPAIDQASILAAIARLRSSKRIRAVKSVVSDNGCEFLNQDKLDKAFGAPVYYTRAYASYEKGGVENCNRILRRWFPKGTDFSKVTAKQLRKVEGYINNIHRPSLDGLTAEQKDRELYHVA